MAGPSTPGASDNAGDQCAASAAVSAPAAGRTGAELSARSALLSWERGEQTKESGTAGKYLPPGESETVYYRMAPKSVGLFVLFHLLALNVVSQLSAFPTPTASADGELAIASDRAI